MFGITQGLASVAGRVLLSLIFAMSVFGKLTNYSGTAEVMAGQGVPAPTILLAGAILFLAVGSISVVLGYKTQIGAVLLLVFLALATFFFHDFWAQPTAAAQQAEMIQFLKNTALMGAMLFLVANGAGRWSLDGVSAASRVVSAAPPAKAGE